MNAIEATSFRNRPTHPATAVRPLDVRLVAMGSHGDVLPFLALGRELRARGHDVTVVANGYHEDLVRRESLEFVQVGTADFYRKYVHHPDLLHPVRGTRVLNEMLTHLTAPIYEHIAEANEPGRTVTAGQCTAFSARVAQEKLGVPFATVNLQPCLLFSADDPPIMNARLSWIKTAPRWCRRFCNFTTSWFMEHAISPPIRDFRRKLGLPDWDNFMEWAYSPAAAVGLFPEWFAPRQADWPAQFRHAEFPLFDGGEGLPDDVEAFLSDGPPPVVFTPGSAQAYTRPFVRAALEACRRLNRRGIILSKFGEDTGDLPSGIRRWNFVPLAPLLPRIAALVHHAGIGTISLALRAGVPQVVVPLAYDQPDNALRAVRLGVARRVNMQGVSGRRLSAALDHVLNSADVAAACRRTAELMPKKPSLAAACEAIEGLIP